MLRESQGWVSSGGKMSIFLNNNNNNECISRALFHVKHVQLR